MAEVKSKAIGFYDGYSIRGNYSVELKFKFSQANLAQALSFVELIGSPIKLGCAIGTNKYKLGIFTIYKFSIDRDAETSISFRSQKESIDIESIAPLLEDEVQITVYGTKSETY